MPNDLLSAVLERATGRPLSWDDETYDDDPDDPWRELHEILHRIREATGIQDGVLPDWDGVIRPIPKTDDLPATATFLPGAVLGLFPIVFDEASQCRLEETLPALMRAKRAVIAGDCQQLPPTRFFEAGIGETAESSADAGADDLFEQRQTEAGDLLSAALNLEVEEVFLDVHYRSRDERLIAYSNRAFYQSRLQTIPVPFHLRSTEPSIRLHEVNGTCHERANQVEARHIVALVAGLLDNPAPPSIGIASFNLPQRDLILETLEEHAERDPAFGRALEVARQRQGADTFEGLFVRNLENVQGDERDVMIVSTTFGPDPEGVFRRHFGVLNSPGGARRLNVLVTRARRLIHIVTSIPRAEFASLAPIPPGAQANGGYHLYAYLAHALQYGTAPAPAGGNGTGFPAILLARVLGIEEGADEWRVSFSLGSPGLRLDAAIDHSAATPPASVAVLLDFSQHTVAGDPLAWDIFRHDMLESAAWTVRRVWTPELFRLTSR